MKVSQIGFLFLLCGLSLLGQEPFPIQFSIPEIKVVEEIPPKTRDFAHIIPGELHTYIYTNEADYYADYQRSYFAITREKGGWDCMRHYEILANGCIPYFLNLDACNPKTMALLPRQLIREAMQLEGVFYNHIDHARFNKKRYYAILEELLAYTKKHLTTRAMAQYMLDQLGYSGKGKILFLSHDPSPDYLRECALIGLKELLGDRVIDYPKIDYLYTNYPTERIASLYGRGFSYTRIIEDLDIDRENIEQRIRDKEFDIIIYGSVHRGLRFHDLVSQIYKPAEISYICGEDGHKCQYARWHNFFLREYDAL